MRWHGPAVLPRLTFRNLIVLTGLITCIGIAQYLFSYTHVRRVDVYIDRPHRPGPHEGTPYYVLGKLPPWRRAPPEPCVGPRGKLITDNPDDQVQPKKLKSPYPTPFTGSFKALELEEEWMTIDGRYGPYGYSDGQWLNKRQPVDWDQVNWGDLQIQCQENNKNRFSPAGQTSFNASEVRFRLKTNEEESDEDAWFYKLREKLGFPKPAEYKLEETGKTALILRTYGKYKYTEEDMMNVRSLVSEASLQSGGDFIFVLFVNIRDSSKGIWESPEKYAAALDEAEVPPEFRHLAVLWDETLLKSWYPKVGTYDILHQINQALQLFALFYPEFDHYWQLEMDMRSLGHTATWLYALDRFSRREPRKQSVERASHLHMPSTQGAYYPDFVSAVNSSLSGGATIWGPVRIPEIPNPIGPPPPVARPEDDPFRWGKGEPADLVVTSPCTWVFRMRAWAFKAWLKGDFSKGRDTPRLTCPPAIQRASRQLLLAVHTAQSRLGLAVPSEATLPSFALWHGLKVSFPPIPYFRREFLDPRTAEIYFNGGRPGEKVKLATPLDTDEGAAELNHDIADFLSAAGGYDGQGFEDGELKSIPFHDDIEREMNRGFACGEAFVNQKPRVALTNGLSWWWQSTFPRRLFAAWSHGRWRKGELAEPGMPDPPGGRVGLVEMGTLQENGGGMLVEEDGEIWAPMGWMHPVKTFAD